MTGEEFADELGLAVFEILSQHLDGRAEPRISATQISWVRRRGFLVLWSAQRWQGRKAAPVVITFAFTQVVESPRWKEVNSVRPGLWNHHLEIRSLDQVDKQVLAWVDRAWEQAA